MRKIPPETFPGKSFRYWYPVFLFSFRTISGAYWWAVGPAWIGSPVDVLCPCLIHPVAKDTTFGSGLCVTAAALPIQWIRLRGFPGKSFRHRYPAFLFSFRTISGAYWWAVARPESALRLCPLSLAYPFSNRKTWHSGAVFVWLLPLCPFNE